MNEQARRAMPPKRVRYPAGCSFASGFSPPRLAATQLPSAICDTTSHRVDFHLPDKYRNTDVLIPAKAGIQTPAKDALHHFWILAFARMTGIAS